MKKHILILFLFMATNIVFAQKNMPDSTCTDVETWKKYYVNQFRNSTKVGLFKNTLVEVPAPSRKLPYEALQGHGIAREIMVRRIDTANKLIYVKFALAIFTAVYIKMVADQ